MSPDSPNGRYVGKLASNHDAQGKVTNVGQHDEPQKPNDPSKDGASPNPNPAIP